MGAADFAEGLATRAASSRSSRYGNRAAVWGAFSVYVTMPFPAAGDLDHRLQGRLP